MNTHSSHSSHRMRSLYWTFAALMILLVATIGLSFADLGAAHTAVGLGIAVAKTLLVMLFFMNLIRSSQTVRLASGASLVWLSFFILCVMSDYLTRGWEETQQSTLPQADHYTSYDRVEYTGPKDDQESDREAQPEFSQSPR